MLTQGDLCPHCGLIIMMPTDLTPECLCCGKSINQETDQTDGDEFYGI